MNELSTISNVKDLVFNPSAMDQMMRLADIMAKSICTVPKHLQNNIGDCFAITMQAAQWGMNPYSVAQKTHLVNGTLGFEAQLVNSVINTMAPIKGRLKFEWRGDWDKYINGGMQKAHEAGLSVVVSGTLQGDEQPTENTTYLAPQTIRNSPLWKTDPKQQLAYLGIKKWARLYCPDVIMGVYTPDEIEATPTEKTINPTPNDKPTVDIDALLKSITIMSIEDFKTIDKDSLSLEQQKLVREAFRARKAAIKEALVVAEVKAEVYQDKTDWSEMISDSESIDELSEIYNSMQPEQKSMYKEAIDFRSSELKSIS